MAIDPVCGMIVSEDTKYKHLHEGKTYLFCSEHCQHKFKAHLQQYLQPIKVETTTASTTTTTTTTYTCPMHPEVRQQGPGICPQCGMALEPRTVAGVEDDAELRDMTMRFWVSTALAIPVCLSAMGAEMIPGVFGAFIAPRPRQIMELLFATPVVLWGGWPFFVRGLLLSPMIATAAMSFSSVSVISNALRLRRTSL